MQFDNVIIEIGTEELPPKSLRTLAEAFAANTTEALQQAELGFESLVWHAAPRRLALTIKALASQQQDKVVEKRGPAVAAAFGADGQPTKAAEGWARANGISVDQAERLKTDKGEWLLHKANVEGKNIDSLLPDLINAALKKLPIPKPMRWGNNTAQFIRPVHTATVLYGDRLIDGEILGIKIANKVDGHRFHGNGQFALTNADQYLSAMREAYVEADFEARKATIRQQLQDAAASEGAQVDMDEELLDEVTALVEWPNVMVASFDDEFLSVPKEALIYTMKDDQKYFPLLDDSGNLLSRFLFVSNIESKDASQVISGNEKVIRPRLADARFFFETDKKQTLESRLGGLEKVTFQKQLGTLKEKVERIASLSATIGKLIGADEQEAYRAGLLSKADLMTNMVMEFPDVQGVMGMHYARIDGESDNVALALDDQYKPRFAGDELPSRPVSCAVALADKLDTLTGIFGIGQLPKGDKDPFALRRAAIGVLRIIVDNGFDLDLEALIEASSVLYGDKLSNADTRQNVLDFVIGRFRNLYLDKGIEIDVIQAVEATKPTKPADFAARIEGVSSFKALEAAEALAAANKRVANILQKNSISEVQDIDPGLLEDAQEKALYQALVEVEAEVQPHIDQAAYAEVLATLSKLRGAIDDFFDNVMVMADNDAVKQNRLALLGKIRQLFLFSADVSLLTSKS